MCAIFDGKSVATTMGFSTADGLVMGTRTGSIDPGVLVALMRDEHMSLDQLEDLLYRRSGLLGLSGVSNDLRDVRAAAEQGNARAQLALDVLVHSARHWIGSLFFALNGCDALVFTAGIGENNPSLRAAICADLDQLGLVLDPAKNAACRTEGEISAANSRVKVFVIPANEELVVARETRRCIQATAGRN